MSTAAAVTAPKVVRFSRKQVLSLFGLVPLSVYVVFHLWTNLYALNGPMAFEQALERSRNHPAFLFLEIFGLGLPILAHTIAGIAELMHGRPNVGRYNYFDNLKYALQRLSAIGLALFIPAHVIKARILAAVAEPGTENIVHHHETWMGMHEALSSPVTFAVYALGILGTVYHLANGLNTASTRWGLVVSPQGRARMQIISAAAFVVLFALAAATLQGFLPFQEVPAEFISEQAQVMALPPQ